MAKVLVAMSGGVDSAVAAKLCCDMGHECIGCTMKLYQNEDAGISRSHTCCTMDDVEDARAVAHRLKMPYYVFNFSDDFREKVIGNFVYSYTHGSTPNPCIDCNRYMKFDKLFRRAQLLGCEYVATGHYARIEQESGQYVLKKAADASKDQSYVLYSMTQQQLSHTLFPLGGIPKSETRQIAERCLFGNARKPDSQDICFVPDGDYAKIIELYTGEKSKPGNFIDTEGNILGTHRGIIHYTVGQRRGLGLPYQQRRYVCDICPDANSVIVGSEAKLYGKSAYVSNLNWISGQVPGGVFRCKATHRYRHPEQWATIEPTGFDTARIEFDEPQKALTPGQALVLYDGETVLGGGTICRD